jgi:S1-C subfamily serine protease
LRREVRAAPLQSRLRKRALPWTGNIQLFRVLKAEKRHHPMRNYRASIALALVLTLLLVQPSQAAEAKLGFSVKVEGGGFFLNPVVTKIIVDDVTKGSIADLAGMKVGDVILQINGQTLAGKRALELRPLMKMDPGETRTMRLKHTDGTEVEVRITKPKG